MLTPRTSLARRVTAALDASPSRVPVLLGGCGSGRSTLLRLLRDHSARFEVIQMPPLTIEDTLDILGPTGGNPKDAEYLARTVLALADGRPSYVRAIAEELQTLREHGGPGSADAMSALAALLSIDGRIAKQCFFCY